MFEAVEGGWTDTPLLGKGYRGDEMGKCLRVTKHVLAPAPSSLPVPVGRREGSNL